MEPIRTILVPTDFSDFAVQAFAQALDLARRQHAEIHLLHVLHEFHTYAWDVIKMSLPQEEEALLASFVAGSNRQLAVFLAEHNDLGVNVTPVTRQGRSEAPAIVAYAKEHDIDLIVMGSHGRRGVERLLLGSVTEEVSHTAPCPVFVAHTTEASTEPARRILVPLDFSPCSPSALDWAGTLASGYNARLILLHVMEAFPPAEVYGPEYCVMAEVTPEMTARAEEEMAEMVDLATTPGVDIESHIEQGYPPEVLIDYAAAQAIDLIVMASHGRTGFKRMMLGSVTEAVMRATPCPVLVVKT